MPAGFRIMTNIDAIYAHRQLSITNFRINRSMEKLSSGYRINQAADDAAGLAVSEKFRTQIKGLEQNAKNTQDAISMIQTAEGGLEELHKMLHRMRVLSVQASNETFSLDAHPMDLDPLCKAPRSAAQLIVECLDQVKKVCWLCGETTDGAHEFIACKARVESLQDPPHVSMANSPESSKELVAALNECDPVD